MVDMRSILIGLLIVAAIVTFGITRLGDRIFSRDTIETKKPLEPKIDIMIHNGVADTTYIYQIP